MPGRQNPAAPLDPPQLPYRRLGGRQRGDAATVMGCPWGAGRGRRGAPLAVGTWGHSRVRLGWGRVLVPSEDPSPR